MTAETPDITPNSQTVTGSDRDLLVHILEDIHDLSIRLEKWERIAGRYLDNPATRWARRNGRT